jgi:phage shock protein A
MDIFSRIETIVKSNINEMLKNSSDPVRTLTAFIDDLIFNHVEVEREAKVLEQEEAKLRSKIDHLQQDISRYGREAESAVKNNDEAKAREFLQQQTELESELENYASILHEQEQVSQDIRSLQAALQDKISYMQQNKTDFMNPEQSEAFKELDRDPLEERFKKLEQETQIQTKLDKLKDNLTPPSNDD